MGKHIVGRETRKEGRERARIFTVIECDACRSRTYERKQRKIQEALKRSCKNCIATAADVTPFIGPGAMRVGGHAAAA